MSKPVISGAYDEPRPIVGIDFCNALLYSYKDKSMAVNTAVHCQGTPFSKEA